MDDCNRVELELEVMRRVAFAAVARVMQISRQALYRVPTPRATPQRRPLTDPVEAAIVGEALANQTDGYRMVCAFVRRKLGVPVNRKRVLRVTRERRLIQRRRPLERRMRPGFFRVERPRQLWQLDMTSIWVAEHGLRAGLIAPRGRTRLEPAGASVVAPGGSRCRGVMKQESPLARAEVPTQRADLNEVADDDQPAPRARRAIGAGSDRAR
ncbi:MAG: IS3 family transposase [Chloroflexi bacterium]|nr:IS3 family transposase [Chloroflexota bacterium]